MALSRGSTVDFFLSFSSESFCLIDCFADCFVELYYLRAESY